MSKDRYFMFSYIGSNGASQAHGSIWFTSTFFPGYGELKEAIIKRCPGMDICITGWNEFDSEDDYDRFIDTDPTAPTAPREVAETPPPAGPLVLVEASKAWQPVPVSAYSSPRVLACIGCGVTRYEVELDDDAPPVHALNCPTRLPYLLPPSRRVTIEEINALVAKWTTDEHVFTIGVNEPPL